jgi:hypothetical protein
MRYPKIALWISKKVHEISTGIHWISMGYIDVPLISQIWISIPGDFWVVLEISQRYPNFSIYDILLNRLPLYIQLTSKGHPEIFSRFPCTSINENNIYVIVYYYITRVVRQFLLYK